MTFILDYLRHEVTIHGKGDPDVYGKFQYNGGTRTVDARVVQKGGILRRPYGKEQAYTYELFLAADDITQLQDRVTFQGRDYEVVDIATFDFIDGTPSHRRARIG